jgi:SulP family sulfate permease
MPLVTGIYAALLPALVAVLFSASVRLSVGPTALTCLLISASLNGLAEPGSAQWVSLAVWLALLSGVLQIVLGLARFGWLLNLVNAPVLMAFTQAAALLILASQLPGMLGLTDLSAAGLGAWMSAPGVHAPSALFGLGALGVLVLARRSRPTFPSVLLLLLGSAGLSVITGFEALGGSVVGPLPSGLPMPYWPAWPGWAMQQQLAMPVLVITLVSFLETASSAKVDNLRRGTSWNQNQDLIGQGLGKLAAALSGAFPTSSSFSRSALNLYAGAQTGWATVVSVVVVALSLVVLTPVLRHVPQPVLAAIVMAAVLSLIRPGQLLRVWRISRVEAVISATTFLATLLAAPRLYWGVLMGVLMALSHYVYLRLHPRIIEVGLHPDGRLRDRHLWQLPPVAPLTLALRMDAELDFGSAAALEQAITDRLVMAPDTRQVVLLAQPLNRIDATGVELFGRLRTTLAAQNRVFVVVGLKLPVERILRSAGELAEGPWLRCHATEAEALADVSALANPQPAGQDNQLRR